jgi:hypothetical protein
LVAVSNVIVQFGKFCEKKLLELGTSHTHDMKLYEYNGYTLELCSTCFAMKPVRVDGWDKQ